jgi:carbon storage regulator
MLVLTRKAGEAIRIGDDIKITLVEIDGNNIKVGIDAPRSVNIHREEVYQRILNENKQAVAPKSADLSALSGLSGLLRKK